MNSRFRFVLSWTLVFLCCMSIFYFSNEQGKDSHSRSGRIVKKVEKVITRVGEKKEKPVLTKKRLEYLVRKTAHVTEYMILTILVYMALRHSGVSGYKRFLGAVLFAVLYASFDELHQYFVSGRDGRMKDVLIDSIGVFLGYMICYTFTCRMKTS